MELGPELRDEGNGDAGGGGGEETRGAGVMAVGDSGAEGTRRMVGWSRGLAPETTPCVRVPGPTPSSPLWPEPAGAWGGGGGKGAQTSCNCPGSSVKFVSGHISSSEFSRTVGGPEE